MHNFFIMYQFDFLVGITMVLLLFRVMSNLKCFLNAMQVEARLVDNLVLNCKTTVLTSTDGDVDSERPKKYSFTYLLPKWDRSPHQQNNLHEVQLFEVCSKAYMLAYGIGKNRFTKVKKAAMARLNSQFDSSTLTSRTLRYALFLGTVVLP